MKVKRTILSIKSHLSVCMCSLSISFAYHHFVFLHVYRHSLSLRERSRLLECLPGVDLLMRSERWITLVLEQLHPSGVLLLKLNHYDTTSSFEAFALFRLRHRKEKKRKEKKARACRRDERGWKRSSLSLSLFSLLSSSVLLRKKVSKKKIKILSRTRERERERERDGSV